jgi:nicotinamidase-related amidase
MAYELSSADTCALALIDHQPQMFFGTHSHERTTILHNVQILAKSEKLFKVPTVLMTVAADSFSGHLLPEVQSVFLIAVTPVRAHRIRNHRSGR